jgi:hypothetical protein
MAVAQRNAAAFTCARRAESLTAKFLAEQFQTLAERFQMLAEEFQILGGQSTDVGIPPGFWRVFQIQL